MFVLFALLFIHRCVHRCTLHTPEREILIHTWERWLKHDLQHYNKGPVHWDLRKKQNGVLQMLKSFGHVTSNMSHFTEEGRMWIPEPQTVWFCLLLLYSAKKRTHVTLSQKTSHVGETYIVIPNLSMTQLPRCFIPDQEETKIARGCCCCCLTLELCHTHAHKTNKISNFIRQC